MADNCHRLFLFLEMKHRNKYKEKTNIKSHITVSIKDYKWSQLVVES